MVPPFNYPKHYEANDDFPAKTPGLLRIYSMQYCPYAQRTVIMLVLHKVKFEIININLGSKPQWFLDKYDHGTVPVLEIDDKVIPESLITSHYIDELYNNGSPIVATDPYERAQENLLIDKYGKVASNFYGQIREVEGARERYLVDMDRFEKELGTKLHFKGGKIGFVDYMIWPWFERQGSWIEEIPSDRFPNLTSWKARMRGDEAVIATATPKEYLDKFVKEYFFAKTPKYDFTL